MPRSNPSPPRRRNRWRQLTPEELQAQAAEQRIQGGGPGALPWQPHPTVMALQERLQLVADCWNLLDGTGGQSWRGLYLPQGSKEPEASEVGTTATRTLTGSGVDCLPKPRGMAGVGGMAGLGSTSLVCRRLRALALTLNR